MYVEWMRLNETHGKIILFDVNENYISQARVVAVVVVARNRDRAINSLFIIIISMTIRKKIHDAKLNIFEPHNSIVKCVLHLIKLQLIGNKIVDIFFKFITNINLSTGYGNDDDFID